MARQVMLWGALVIVVIAGLAIHVDLAERLTDFLDPDEAVVALMARHIAAARSLPVFYYGQPYLGALEAYGLAGAFTLGGPSPPMARAYAVVVWIGLVAATFALGYRVGGLSVATLASALIAIAPPDVLLWHLKVRGGFTLSAVLLAIVCALARPRRSQPRQTLALGIVAGLALWTNQLTVPAVAVILVATAHEGAHRPRLIAGVLIGAAPLLWYNIVHPLATLRYLAAHLVTGMDGAAAELARFLGDTLPRFMGGAVLADRLGIDSVAALGPLVTTVGLGALLLVRGRRIAKALLQREPLALGDLLLIALVVSLPARRNYQLNQLLHWTPLLAVLLAWLPIATGRRWLTVVPAALVALASIETAVWLPTFHESGTAVHRLVALLDSRDVAGAFAEHRPCYLIAFFSDERIAATPSLSSGYLVDRYPPYAARVATARRKAWVFEAGSASERAAVAAGRVAGPPTEVAGYHVYFREPDER